MTRAKRVAAAGGALALTIALAGCSGDEGSTESGTTAVETSAGPAQETNEQRNDADVTFAQMMIPHHAQALSMADLALQKAESPDVRRLAEQIQVVQVPEIETMTTWLTNWGEEVPATSRDHSAEHGGEGDMSGDVAGMMTEEEMAQLEGSSGAEFDRVFLELMVRHHQSAIEMAATEQADGQNAEALALAQEIEASQAQEVTEMHTLLQSL
jgi:uncharacterized protein (DUF305 family)